MPPARTCGPRPPGSARPASLPSSGPLLLAVVVPLRRSLPQSGWAAPARLLSNQFRKPGDRLMSKYLVISSDGHAGPPAAVYRDYLDPAFREAFDRHQEELEAGRMVDQSSFVQEWDEETGDAEMKAGYDPATRDAILDQEGVAAEVLFPDADVLGTGRLASSPFGSGLGSGRDADPAAVKAGARAHNRWLAAFCATNPARRLGGALVPTTAGVDDAVAQVHEAAEAGLRGILIPTRWFDGAAYHDLAYDPVWSACEEAGMVLHTHSGAGPSDYEL